MSDAGEMEYLDVHGVAARVGLKHESISEFARRGDMPAPDLVWLKRKLWLPDTIDQWRKQRYMRRHKRPMIRRQDVAAPTRPPRLAKATRPGAAMPKGAKDKRSRRKSSSVGASQKPALSSVDDQLAGDVAAELRAQGHYCTTADVMVLADADPEGLEHERQQLQQRVRRLLATRRR